MIRSPLGKVGLIACGGGSRGLVQVAYLRAFKDFGITYDHLFACSVGALNGAMLHQDNLDGLEKLWLNIKNDDVYKWGVLDSNLPFTEDACIFDSKPLRRLIEDNLDVPSILANPIPFTVNTTDISTWSPLSLELHKLNPGDCIDFIYASASPPILFPNVLWHNHRLADGGVVNNFSIAEAIDAGCDTLFILAPTKYSPKPINNLINMVEATMSISMSGYFARELREVERINQLVLEGVITNKRLINTVIIQPEKALDIGLIDFSYKNIDRKQLILDSYNFAMDILKKELSSVHRL